MVSLSPSRRPLGSVLLVTHKLRAVEESLEVAAETTPPILVFGTDFAGVLLTWFVGDVIETSSLFTEGSRLRAEEVVVCVRTRMP